MILYYNEETGETIIVNPDSDYDMEIVYRPDGEEVTLQMLMQENPRGGADIYAYYSVWLRNKETKEPIYEEKMRMKYEYLIEELEHDKIKHNRRFGTWQKTSVEMTFNYKDVLENLITEDELIWIKILNNKPETIWQFYLDPDSNYYDMYKSAYQYAKTMIDDLHQDDTDDERDKYLIAYFNVFVDAGIKYLENNNVRTGPSRQYIDLDKLIADLYELAEECTTNGELDVEKFLRALDFKDVYYNELLDTIIKIFKDAGFEIDEISSNDYNYKFTLSLKDKDGNVIESIEYEEEYNTGEDWKFPIKNATFTYKDKNGKESKVEWSVSDFVDNDDDGSALIQVIKTTYTNNIQDGRPKLENYKFYKVGDRWHLERL